MVSRIRKRSGKIVSFKADKISDAIHKALLSEEKSKVDVKPYKKRYRTIYEDAENVTFKVY